MKIRNGGLGIKYLTITIILSQGIRFSALAHEGEDHTTTPAPKTPKPPSCQILTADRLFDGVDLHLDWAVLIKKEKIFAVGPQAQIKKAYCPKTKLGDATILPGFIESHAHITFQNIVKNKMLEHGKYPFSINKELQPALSCRLLIGNNLELVSMHSHPYDWILASLPV